MAPEPQNRTPVHALAFTKWRKPEHNIPRPPAARMAMNPVTRWRRNLLSLGVRTVPAPVPTRRSIAGPISRNATSVDVERAGTVLLDVVDDAPLERLSRQKDRLVTRA